MAEFSAAGSRGELLVLRVSPLLGNSVRLGQICGAVDTSGSIAHHAPPMALTIVVRTGDGAARPRLTVDKSLIVLGRGEGVDVCLPDPSVSERHATLRRRGRDYLLVDEGSANGTFVGSVRLPPDTPRLVRPGELVRIGRIWLEIELGPQLDAIDDTRALALDLVARALAADNAETHPALRLRSSSERRLLLAEEERRYVLGRSREVDWQLTDSESSRRHAEVWRSGHYVFVRDLGSKNGTFLGQQLLPVEAPVLWRLGVELIIGCDVIELEDPLQHALAQLEAAPLETLAAGDVDPPVTTTPSQPEPHVALELLYPRGPEAPIAAVPANVVTAPVEAPPRRWSTVDLAVAGAALVLLVLSGLGIYLLFR